MNWYDEIVKWRYGFPTWRLRYKIVFIVFLFLLLGFKVLPFLMHTFSPSKSSEARFSFTGSSSYGQTNAQGQTINVTNNYGNPETDKVVKVLEGKIQNTQNDVTLTKQDVDQLKKSLQELSNRTAGLERLPDGTTRIGGFLSGIPSVVIDNHNQAIELNRQGKYEDALMKSKIAITAHEETSVALRLRPAGITAGGLSDQDYVKIYLLAVQEAFNLAKFSEALEYANVAVSIQENPNTLSARVAAYANLKQISKAKELIKEAQEKFSKDSQIKELKERLDSIK